MSSYRVINFINGDFISFPMEGENYSGTTFTYEEDKDGLQLEIILVLQ